MFFTNSESYDFTICFMPLQFVRFLPEFSFLQIRMYIYEFLRIFANFIFFIHFTIFFQFLNIILPYFYEFRKLRFYNSRFYNSYVCCPNFYFLEILRYSTNFCEFYFFSILRFFLQFLNIILCHKTTPIT